MMKFVLLASIVAILLSCQSARAAAVESTLEEMAAEKYESYGGDGGSEERGKKSQGWGGERGEGSGKGGEDDGEGRRWGFGGGQHLPPPL